MKPKKFLWEDNTVDKPLAEMLRKKEKNIKLTKGYERNDNAINIIRKIKEYYEQLSIMTT
jgi:hypothetical protein